MVGDGERGKEGKEGEKGNRGDRGGGWQRTEEEPWRQLQRYVIVWYLSFYVLFILTTKQTNQTKTEISKISSFLGMPITLIK